jgi:hypothetical protein
MLLLTLAATGQQTSVVPTQVNFKGILSDLNGKPWTGTVGVTFYLYKDSEGGAPLWMETQNVTPDKSGRYTVSLGATTSSGLPTDVFVSGEARWLGVQPEGQAEQSRVLLLSVPYALKAGDAETIGGLPASAFVLANSAITKSTTSASPSASSKSTAPPANPAVTGKGVVDYIPMWDTTSDIADSVIFQKTSEIGIATTAPAATLDVNGKTDVRDTLTLFPKSTDSTLVISGTTFKIDQTGKVTFVSGQIFPGTGTITGITTSTGSGLSGGGTTGTLSLKVPSAGITNAMLQSSKIILNANTAGGLTTPGAMTLGSTYTMGLKPCSTNQILQYSGTAWNCAAAGTGTITGVTAGTDLKGGGTSGNVTLNLDTTKVPQLSANNSFSGNQSVTGNLKATGSITGQTANFSANNSTQVVSVTQSGTGSGIVATMPTSVNSYIPAIVGNATNTTGYGIGVQGISAASNGQGIYGWATNSANGTNGYGVSGEADTSSGAGVSGFAGSQLSGASAVGVRGISATSNGIGVDGYESSSTSGIGVRGVTNGRSGVGVAGRWSAGSAIAGAEAGVWGDSSTGLGVLGTTDNSQGVAGWASNNGTGVYANSYNGNGLFATSTNNWAVVGNSPLSGGVYGISQSIAGTYGAYAYGSQSGAGFTTVGVWGDTGFGNGFGVVGTADNGNSFFGKNNTVNHETLYVENDSGFSGGFTPYAARFAGPGSSTYCEIVRDSADNGTGDLICTGSKSAAVPVDGNRMVRLYAVEAADNWFEDAGSGQLANGSATVALDQVFAQTVNGDVDYHVFITPNGECEGLYVTQKSAQDFEVRELHGGHSNTAFDYRIMARRKGFENVRMQDVTADFAHVKQQSDLLAARLEARKQEEKAHPKMEAPAPPQRSPLSSPSSPRTPVLPVEPARLVGSIK